VDLGGNVLPGETRTIMFDVTAPTTPGVYNFQWQIFQRSSGWFGTSPSENVVVDVRGVNCTSTCTSDGDCVSGHCETSVTPHQCWARAPHTCYCNGTTGCDGVTCNTLPCAGYCCPSPGPNAVCCTGGLTCGDGNTCNIGLPYTCTE